MSTITIKVELDTGGELSVDLPLFEYGDVGTHQRRQVAGETDGGQLFVQDLMVEDQFIDFTWEWLSEKDRSNLLLFLRAANFRQKPITFEISGKSFPTGLNTGQTFNGAALTTGMTRKSCEAVLNTGATVQPDVAILNNVFLEQSEVSLEQIRNENSNVTLRVRIPGGPIVAGG